MLRAKMFPAAIPSIGTSPAPASSDAVGVGALPVRKLPPPPMLPSRPKIGRFPDEVRRSAPATTPPPKADPGPVYSDLDPTRPRKA